MPRGVVLAVEGGFEGGSVPGKRSHGGQRQGGEESAMRPSCGRLCTWERRGAERKSVRVRRLDLCSNHLLAAGWRRIWPFSRGPPPPQSR